MQTANVNVPVRVDGRHITVTEAMRQHVTYKVEQLHLDYPRIIEVHVVVDVQKHGNRHFAEVILRCADHITLEASETSDDLYASLDASFAKIAQQMRKAKARHLLGHRSKHKPSAEAA
ncbi:MAG: ribosome-associated translation inhibitor RaiA [Verrucomicrobiota bacterium]|jgi:putative sigma-54 modulation protein